VCFFFPLGREKQARQSLPTTALPAQSVGMGQGVRRIWAISVRRQLDLQVCRQGVSFQAFSSVLGKCERHGIRNVETRKSSIAAFR
jgi:hypothetical protein